MENYPRIKFVVGEEYKNEKGLFEVLSVKGDRMKIRWENGEELTCDVGVQRRIQERRHWEKLRRVQVAAAKTRSAAVPQAQQAFEGLRAEDFKDKISRSPWRGRYQLGGAVSRLLRAQRPRFESWAAKRRNDVYWADARHWKLRGGECGVKFVARANSQAFAWGLGLTSPLPETAAALDWQALMRWLARDGNDAWLLSVARESGLGVFDAGPPVLTGLLTAADGGWLSEAGKRRRFYERLPDAFNRLPSYGAKDLVLAVQVTRQDALARGKDIVADIARVFESLMPLYEAAADGNA